MQQPSDGILIQSSTRLSPREREVAALVAEGLSRKKIASRLAIEIGTVDAHIGRIADKIPGTGRPAVRITRFVLTASSTGFM